MSNVLKMTKAKNLPLKGLQYNQGETSIQELSTTFLNTTFLNSLL